jgi:hypothetical protein
MADDWTTQRGWNGWEHCGTNLRYEAYPPNHYEIDLADCTTSAKVLDWIIQIEGKAWADPMCLAGLIRAFNDILDPQTNLCSGGHGKVMTVEAIRACCTRCE